jgi:hypothetical protein
MGAAVIARLALAALLVSSLASAQQGTVCQAGPGYAACSRAAVRVSVVHAEVAS